MNIEECVATFQRLAPEFALTRCIVNGSIMNLSEIECMGYDEFAFRSKINMPLRLYHYFPNSTKEDREKGIIINHSIESLENNTVYLQAPTKFDDVYDSDISLDYHEYEHLRLLEYCHRCEIDISKEQSTQDIGDALVKKLYDFISATGTLDHVLTKVPDSEIEKLANQVFEMKVMLELASNPDLGAAIAKVIFEEFKEYTASLQTAFRVACFTTTPYSQLMWGSAYANCHNGFCAEYTILPNDESYKQVYYNLFPVIYCKSRPYMASRIIDAKDKAPTKETLWDNYLHGVLRKSIDWAFQNEWRLLLPLCTSEGADYNVKFFPITRVYLGNRMSSGKRKQIIEICHNKNIPYVGVKRNPTIYEMQDCEVKCEDCPQYLNPIQN